MGCRGEQGVNVRLEGARQGKWADGVWRIVGGRRWRGGVGWPAEVREGAGGREG